MRRIRLYDGYVEQVDDLEVDDLIQQWADYYHSQITQEEI